MQTIILLLLVIGGLTAFFLPVCKRLKIIQAAPGKFSLDNLHYRIGRVISEVLFQSKVIKHRPLAGLMHAFVFWGFIAFVIVTINHFARGFTNFQGSLLGHGEIYWFISSFVAIFAVLVIIGITYLFIRRFFFRPGALGKHLSWTSGLVALFIEILMFTYLIDYIMGFSDIGKPFVEILLIPFGGAHVTMWEQTTTFHVLWWLHSVVILAFLALIPQSKHLHLILAPFTIFLKDLQLARIKPLDIEKEEIGIERLSQLDKHSVLSAFSCVECGRCFDHCPARNTGKVLDPKQWMLDLRKGLLINPQMENPGDVLNFEMIWQCTTCGACTYQCPVGIDQVIPLIGFRRGFVANGEFPGPMRPLFDNLERSGNPWKYQPAEALDFIEEAQIPLYQGQEYIYWMGCMGRYDVNYRKVSKKFSQLLKSAGLDFGVLAEESCTGDAARRAGNEFLFLSLAEGNIELLNGCKARKIITTCPHCLRTLQEYKDLGLDKSFSIVHHTTFITELIASGKLKPVKSGEKVVYHDACYLSRYQAPSGWKQPRGILHSAGVSLVDAKRCKDESFCCGAGGGMLFAEETEGERINHNRVKELADTGAKTIAVACPFCQLMLKDGLKDKGIEGVEVKDLSELI